MSIGFHHPGFLWFLLFLIPLALVYMYLTRRASRVFPSLKIWRSTTSAEAQLLNQPIKRFLEWLFASLFVLFVTLLAAGIHIRTSPDAQQLLMLVDNSSSMTRTDTESSASTFLKRSVNQLHKVLRHLPKGRRWRVYQLAPTPRLAGRGTGPITEPRFSQLSAAPLQASGTRLERFLNSLLDSSVRPYLYTDQQLPELPALLQTHSDLQIIPVGGPAGNVAITSASLKRRWNGRPRTVHLILQNYSDSSRTFPIRLYGMTKQNRQTTISAKQTKHIQIPVKYGPDPPDRLGVVLDTADPFPTDNGAYFLRRTQQPIPVRIELPSPSSRFVRSAITSAGPSFTLVSERSDTDRSSTVRYQEPLQLLETKSNTPPEPGTISFVNASDEENRKTNPEPISRSSDSPLTTGLDFQELTIENFSPLQPEEKETCLLTSGSLCLALLGRSDRQRPYVRFGFALSDSNFPLLPEFPVLIQRILKHLQKRTHQSNPNHHGSPTHQLLDEQTVTRTWLRPTGGLTQNRIDRSDGKEQRLPPGWYRSANGQKRWTASVNFFYPNESNMNRTFSTVENRISTSSPPSQSTPNQPVPLRQLILLFLMVTWCGFLILSIY